MPTPAKRVGTRANTSKKRPAEVVDLPKPDDLEQQAKSPYPKGVQIFSYQPEDGSSPIPLPVNGFEQPNKLWHFDVAQLPRLAQTWKWMDHANIPKHIQRQTQMLPDLEYFKMFDAWFEACRAANQAGGPKGAVTSGK